MYLEEEYLSRLEEIIKSAKLTGVGNCGFLVFGSWGGYSISNEADDEFWEMFGLSADGYTRLFPGSIEVPEEYTKSVEENTKENTEERNT